MEKFTPLATNFTLPPGLTGWTNFTSEVLTAPGLSLHAKLSEQIAKPSKIKMTLVKAKNDNVKHGL